MSAYTRFESDGAMATSIFPTGDFGRPVCSTFRQVAPASCDTYIALDGPPLYIAYVCISTCHMPANSVPGSWASSVSPEQPVFASTKSERTQLRPPSTVRYTPRSCCGPVARPSTHAYTMSGFSGWMMIRPMRPDSGSPMFVQVAPASVDL